MRLLPCWKQASRGLVFTWRKRRLPGNEGHPYYTSGNRLSPNTPPKDVPKGWNTTDEMMNFIIYCLDYQPGDEFWEY